MCYTVHSKRLLAQHGVMRIWGMHSFSGYCILCVLSLLQIPAQQPSLCTKHSACFTQQQDQYMFIHDAILESVTCGDTQIDSGRLRKALAQLQVRDETGRSGLDLQFSVS